MFYPAKLTGWPLAVLALSFWGYGIGTAGASQIADKIYWANQNTGVIQRASLDGTDVEDVRTVDGAPRTLAIDSQGCVMYWSEEGGTAIMKANLDGTGTTQAFYTFPDSSYYALELWRDDANDFMYWSTLDGRIYRSALNSSNADYGTVEELLTFDSGIFVNRQGLVVDTTTSPYKVYFADTDELWIKEQDWGTEEQDDYFLDDLSNPDYVYEPESLAIDTTNGYLYYTDRDLLQVNRAPLDDPSQVETVYQSTGQPRGLYVDAAAGEIYWVDPSGNKVVKSNTSGSIAWEIDLPDDADGTAPKPMKVVKMYSNNTNPVCFTTTTTTQTMTSTTATTMTITMSTATYTTSSSVTLTTSTSTATTTSASSTSTISITTTSVTITSTTITATATSATVTTSSATSTTSGTTLTTTTSISTTTNTRTTTSITTTDTSTTATMTTSSATSTTSGTTLTTTTSISTTTSTRTTTSITTTDTSTTATVTTSSATSTTSGTTVTTTTSISTITNTRTTTSITTTDTSTTATVTTSSATSTTSGTTTYTTTLSTTTSISTTTNTRTTTSITTTNTSSTATMTSSSATSTTSGTTTYTTTLTTTTSISTITNTGTTATFTTSSAMSTTIGTTRSTTTLSTTTSTSTTTNTSSTTTSTTTFTVTTSTSTTTNTSTTTSISTTTGTSTTTLSTTTSTSTTTNTSTTATITTSSATSTSSSSTTSITSTGTVTSSTSTWSSTTSSTTTTLTTITTTSTLHTILVFSCSVILLVSDLAAFEAAMASDLELFLQMFKEAFAQAVEGVDFEEVSVSWPQEPGAEEASSRRLRSRPWRRLGDAGNVTIIFEMRLPAQDPGAANITADGLTSALDSNFWSYLTPQLNQSAVIQDSNIALLAVFTSSVTITTVWSDPDYFTTATSTTSSTLTSATWTTSTGTNTSTATTSSTSTSTSTTTTTLPVLLVEEQPAPLAATFGNWIFFAVFALCCCLCCCRWARMTLTQPDRGSRPLPFLGPESMAGFIVIRPEGCQAEEGTDVDGGKTRIIWYTRRAEVEEFFKKNRVSPLDGSPGGEISGSEGDPGSLADVPNLQQVLDDIAAAAESREAGPLGDADDEDDASSVDTRQPGEEQGGLEPWTAGDGLEASSEGDVIVDVDEICLELQREGARLSRSWSSCSQAVLLFDNGSEVEHYSSTNHSWRRGTLRAAVVGGDENGVPEVHYRVVFGNGQERLGVAPDSMRAPFKGGDEVEVFSGRRGGEWLPAVVYGKQLSSATLVGYHVRLLDEDGLPRQAIERVPAIRLRRRFAVGQAVQVYSGPDRGFESAHVVAPLELPPQDVLDLLSPLSPWSPRVAGSGDAAGSGPGSPRGVGSASHSSLGSPMGSPLASPWGSPREALPMGSPLEASPLSSMQRRTYRTADSLDVRSRPFPWSLVRIEQEAGDIELVPSYCIRRVPRRAFRV